MRRERDDVDGPVRVDNKKWTGEIERFVITSAQARQDLISAIRVVVTGVTPGASRIPCEYNLVGDAAVDLNDAMGRKATERVLRHAPEEIGLSTAPD